MFVARVCGYEHAYCVITSDYVSDNHQINHQGTHRMQPQSSRSEDFLVQVCSLRVGLPESALSCAFSNRMCNTGIRELRTGTSYRQSKLSTFVSGKTRLGTVFCTHEQVGGTSKDAIVCTKVVRQTSTMKSSCTPNHVAVCAHEL